MDPEYDPARSPRRRVRTEHIEHLWSPARVLILFVVVSLAWIIGTDWLLQRLVSDERLMAVLPTLKGLLWIALVGLMLYLLLARARRNQRLLHEEVSRYHDELESRVRERTGKLLDSREQLRQLTRRLDRLGEIERKRISRELHDQLGSDLTGLKIDLQAVRKRLPPEDAASAERLDAVLALVDSMYLNLRELAAQLRPAILDQFGLVAGIEWLVAEFRKRTGGECTAAIEDPGLPPDDLRDTVLFRICQESLTNVLKHAEASRVTVSLGVSDGVLRLVVEDDGRGTSESVAGSRDKLGIVGMRERAFSIGGEAVMEARPGGGTRVRVEVPLTQDGDPGVRT